MSYNITHWTGAMESDYPIDQFVNLLDEMSSADSEHPDVNVSHESEWSLSVYRTGFVVLENLEEGDPVHLGPVDRSTTLELMVGIAEGRIDEVRSKPWRPGYPPALP